MSQLLHNLINRGIKQDDPIEVHRQIGLLNIATLCAFTVLFFFMALNIYYHNWILLANNCVLLILVATLPFIHKLRHFNEAIIVLCILFSMYFFANDVLFHNAQRYILLPMMVVSVLLIQSNTWRIVVLSLQITFFMLVLLLQGRPAIIAPLPVYRLHMLTFTMLVILAITLQYFKRKQLQYIKNLSKLNRQLLDSNQVKERMLSILSHDFNAPVANLVATLNLVDAEILTPQQFSEVSAKLQAQLNVLTTSLTDVLNWSKMQVSGDVGTATVIPVRQLFDEVALLFKYALEAKNLHIINNIDTTITAFANKDHIKLVFRNLLSNAIKFSHQGKKITVNSYVQGDKISIGITDEGTGIAPAVLEALQKEELSFNSQAGTANERGTGLGLMLVREFLQKSGGSVTIESVQGQGSTFTIWVPAAC